MNIPKEVQTALQALKNSGYEAYIVGGCVRDMLLGLTPKDFDITTSALPEQIKAVFKAYRIIETGIKHGTVTVVIENTPLEITTFRTDGTYTDNRRPDYVTFTASIKEDVLRRDFTVNAMCYNPKNGLVDYCGGKEDLERKLIRAVGVPSERFKEDSLRILRALRFASVYGFEIEAETANAILEYKHLLKNVASERISVEINKLLCGENVYKILKEIFPEFENANGFSQNSPYHIYDIWEHIAVATGAIKGEKICRLAMFFHDIGKLYTYSTDEKGIGHFYNHANVSENKAKDILKRLKYDNETTEKVLKLIKYHDLVIENNEVQIKKLLSKLGEEQFFRLLEIKKADTLAQSKDLAYRLIIVDEISATANRVLEEAQCFSLKDLAVNGNDIMTLGYKGKRVGEILNLLLENVIANNLPNSKEKLIEYVKDLHI